MTPPKLHPYGGPGFTPDFKEMARVSRVEEEAEEQNKRNNRSPIFSKEKGNMPQSFLLGQTYDDDSPSQYVRPGELPYEDEELRALKKNSLARNIFPDSSVNSHNKRPDDFTPKRKQKIIRNESPDPTPSPPLVLSSIPTPWQPSPPQPSPPKSQSYYPKNNSPPKSRSHYRQPSPPVSQSFPPPIHTHPERLCLYCLQSPCDNKEDLDDTRQRLSMYFASRVFDRANDIPGNSQRRRTFRAIYKDIVLAKGRDVYARNIPPCVKASAQTLFPMDSPTY